MIPARIDISVPPAEAERALALGAQWDGSRRTFVMPRGCQAHDFERWWGTEGLAGDTLVIGPFFLLSVSTSCSGCAQACTVYALAVSALQELGGVEPCFHGPFVLHSLERIDSGLGTLYRRLVPRLALARVDRRAPRRLLNHCSCGTPQPGPEAGREGGQSVFNPATPEQAAALTHSILPLSGVFSVRGGWFVFGELGLWWRTKRAVHVGPLP